MDTRTRRSRRRAGLAALAAGPGGTALGVAAHLLAGGAVPSAAVVVAFAALLGLTAATAVSRFLVPTWAIALFCGLSQQALHLVLVPAALVPGLWGGSGHHGGDAPRGAVPEPVPTAVPDPGAAADSAAAAGAAHGDLHLIVVTHLAAAVLTAAVVSLALARSSRLHEGAGRATGAKGD